MKDVEERQERIVRELGLGGLRPAASRHHHQPKGETEGKDRGSMKRPCGSQSEVKPKLSVDEGHLSRTDILCKIGCIQAPRCS